MNSIRRGLMAAVVCGALACVPQAANAQGLWVGGWGWGGPVAIGGFGPGFGPGFGLGFGPAFGPGAYGFGPRYVSSFSSVGWGYPAYRGPYYGSAFYRAPVYAPVYRPAPVYVGPSAHAIRVGNRVARRSWRRGWGW